MTIYKIFTAPAGHYKDRSSYKFVASFADGATGGLYCSDMRDKSVYRNCDIIMEEVHDVEIDDKPGEIVCAIAVTGEYLMLEEV